MVSRATPSANSTRRRRGTRGGAGGSRNPLRLYVAGHGLPVGRRQPHRSVRDPPRGPLEF